MERQRVLRVCVECSPQTTATAQAIRTAIGGAVARGKLCGVEVVSEADSRTHVVISDLLDVVRRTYSRGRRAVFVEGTLTLADDSKSLQRLQQDELREHAGYVVVAPFGQVTQTVIQALIAWRDFMNRGDMPPSSRQR